MAIVTSVMNMKGGVGKTTLTHHLATGLTMRRKRTLMIDLDPQCSLSLLAVGHSYYEKVKSGTPTIKKLFEGFLTQSPPKATDLILKKTVTSSKGHIYNHVDIVFSHENLTSIDAKLNRFRRPDHEDHEDLTSLEVAKLSVLKQFLDEVATDYDYVFIDCPASLHPVAKNAIFASDYFLVPTRPDHLSTVGLPTIQRQIEDLNRRFQSLCSYIGLPYTPTQYAGVIFNMVDEHKGSPKRNDLQYINSVRAQEPNSVFENYLVEGDAITQAAQKHHPLYAFETSKDEKIRRQIDNLQKIITEFMIRVHKEDRT